MLHEEIRRSNDERRSEACPQPEVDIVDVWRRILHRCGIAAESHPTRLVVQLAAAYEARANPTWPMPGATELLARLHERRSFRWGSSATLRSSLPVWSKTCSWKNRSPMADLISISAFFRTDFGKRSRAPDCSMHCADGLARRSILPHEAIYVGNDMLNDVWAASQAGLENRLVCR